jgi:DNA-directed RNA polymerase specialized sigma24 family protein
VERERACLDRCLDRLASAERRIVLGYFEGERGARIRKRSELARELGVSLNALRLRIHRVTGRLRECVVRCVDQGGRVGAASGLRRVREATE